MFQDILLILGLGEKLGGQSQIFPHPENDTIHRFRIAFNHITSPQNIMMSHKQNTWFEPY